MDKRSLEASDVQMEDVSSSSFPPSLLICDSYVSQSEDQNNSPSTTTTTTTTLQHQSNGHDSREGLKRIKLSRLGSSEDDKPSSSVNHLGLESETKKRRSNDL